MLQTKDTPRVYIPPPLIYAGLFLLSLPAQAYLPLDHSFLGAIEADIIGTLITITGLSFITPALHRFFKTRNTVITVRPAASLQTTGIYSLRRNPMYLGLLFIYAGLAFLWGNWWTLLSTPVLMVIVTRLIIIPEEKYLERAFGQSFLDYKANVRRWI